MRYAMFEYFLNRTNHLHLAVISSLVELGEGNVAEALVLFFLHIYFLVINAEILLGGVISTSRRAHQAPT